MSKHILESLYGIGGNDEGHPPSIINTTRDRVDQNAIRRDPDDGIELAKSRDFDDEYVKNTDLFTTNDEIRLNENQLQILQYFQNRKDAFVSYPPSAGKTAPILKGLKSMFYNRLINPLAITPHILYVVPRKQLAAQMADEFREAVFDKQLKKAFRDTNARTTQIPTQLLERQAYQCVAEQTGGQKDSIGINFYDGYVPMVVATYDTAKGLISNSQFARRLTHIIVDEVQELVPHPGQGPSAKLDNDYSSLTTILANAPSMGRSCIILMTGSINQTSIKYLSDYFNKTYNRRFDIIPRFNPNIAPQPYGSQTDNHEGQLLNRSKISLQPLKPLSGFPTSTIPARLNLIKDVVVNKQFESVMIIFSKQRTGQGIFRMLEESIKMLPAYPSNYFFEEDNDHVKQVIQNNGQGMNLSDKMNIEYLKYFDLNNVLSNNQESANTGTIKDENNILYQSVRRGVAPLVGSMNQLHKKIVQYYFSDRKKIHMILGTDALG